MAAPESKSIQQWVWRGGTLGVLVLGWFFILLQNNFHITPSVVFVCMGFFAGVAAIFTLFQTGATAVAGNEEDDGGASWGRPLGPIGELEREKRALLKAIKEAEFDHQMGKLSKLDAESMINGYRARAIDVIKELERRNGVADSVRAEIQREIKARLVVGQQADAKKAQGKTKADKRKKPAGEAAREAAKAAAVAAEAASKAAAAAAAAASPGGSDIDDEAADEAADAAADVAMRAAKQAEEAAIAAREAADAIDDKSEKAESAEERAP